MSRACDSSNASAVPTYITDKTNEGKEQSVKLQCGVEKHFYRLNVFPVKTSSYCGDFETGEKAERHRKQSIEVKGTSVFLFVDSQKRLFAAASECVSCIVASCTLSLISPLPERFQSNFTLQLKPEPRLGSPGLRGYHLHHATLCVFLLSAPLSHTSSQLPMLHAHLYSIRVPCHYPGLHWDSFSKKKIYIFLAQYYYSWIPGTPVHN